MKNLICFFFTLVVFLTDLNASVPKTDAIMKFPVKEIEKEKVEAGLLIEDKLVNTSEDGGVSSISIQLKKQPIAIVEVNCRSLNEREGKVRIHKLEFTKKNWNKSQQCTVVGEDDDMVDGNREYIILIEVTSKKDIEYTRIIPYPVTLVNLDNDQAGIEIKQIGKNTSEEGKSATVLIRLSSKPMANVIASFRSNNKKEGLTQLEPITFSPDNWNNSQVLTITGQDDFVADGSVSYAILFAPLKSADPLFHDLTPAPIYFINEDNDRAAYLISSLERTTGENGLETSIAARLQSKPVDRVVLNFSSSNNLEGDANPGQVIFTPQNWNQSQTIRVFGIDDSIDDDDQPFILEISAKKSGDKKYARLPEQKLTFVNKDDDKAGFIIFKNQLETTENGGLGKFSLKLTSKPTADIKLNFRSSDPSEGRLLLNSFVYTPDDWFLEKTISVKGIDDDVVDGDQTYQILINKPVTSDPLYAAFGPQHVGMINKDDEKTGLAIETEGSETSENGRTVSFFIQLNARPTSDVFLTLASSDASEGKVTPQKLHFTPDQWNQTQTAIMTGQPDGLVDGNQSYKLNISVFSKDTKFKLSSPGIPLTNKDVNSFDFLHQLAGEETSEQGRESALLLKLNSNPGEALTVVVKSDDPGEGRVMPETLVFDNSNWQEFQTVKILGVDDNVKDGPQAYHIKAFARGEGKGYHDNPPFSVRLINQDDDQEGITVKQLSHITKEATEHAEFSVKLNSEPASSVIFIFSTTDPTEGQMIDHHAAFFPENWDKEQVIRVGCIRDYVVDGSREFQVSSLGAISKDPNYNKMSFPTLDMVCHDSDQAGFVVSDLSGRATEDGAKATFNLKLSTRPTAPVKVDLDSNDKSEGAVSPGSLMFDANNWKQGHRVTVTGLDDDEKDGDTDFYIMFTQAISDDANYTGLSPEPVPVTNRDNMKMAFGTTITRFEFRDGMKDKLDESLAIGLFGAYVYTRNIDLDVAVYSFSSEGDNIVQKYNVENPMSYRLDYNSFLAGARYAFWRAFMTVYAKGGAEIAYWNLDSLNNLSGNKETNSGSSMGIYTGFGADYSILGGFILALEWSYHFVSRGLGNNRSTFAIKYPF